MNTQTVQILFSISLKARILRAWQAANRAQDQEFTERELLILELVRDFGPIWEKSLCKIFGVSFSSVADALKPLLEKGLIDGKEKQRGKPLALTERGEKCLDELKRKSATRLGYLFSGLDASDLEHLERIFLKVDRAADRAVKELVFDRFDVE